MPRRQYDDQQLRAGTRAVERRRRADAAARDIRTDAGTNERANNGTDAASDRNAITASDIHAAPDRDSGADAAAYADSGAHADPGADADAEAKTHTETDADPATDRCADCSANADAAANAGTVAHASTVADPGTLTYAGAIAVADRLKRRYGTTRTPNGLEMFGKLSLVLMRVPLSSKISISGGMQHSVAYSWRFDEFSAMRTAGCASGRTRW